MTASSNRLPILQDEIRIAHRDARDAAKTAVDRARDAGAKLLEAKDLLGHGEWLPWLKETGVSPRTAQKYMRLARIPDAKYAATAHLTIDAALDAVAEKTLNHPLDRVEAALSESLALEERLAELDNTDPDEWREGFAILKRKIDLSHEELAGITEYQIRCEHATGLLMLEVEQGRGNEPFHPEDYFDLRQEQHHRIRALQKQILALDESRS
jgi:hypothetical protein